MKEQDEKVIRGGGEGVGKILRVTVRAGRSSVGVWGEMGRVGEVERC